MELRKRLCEKLKHPEYRYAYADEALNLFLASQLRVLREQRKLSQAELAKRIGTRQAGVSRLESANYSGWTIKTLKRVARGLDLRLKVSFEPFGTLWREVATRDRKHLERLEFDKDPEFMTQIARTSIESNELNIFPDEMLPDTSAGESSTKHTFSTKLTQDPLGDIPPIRAIVEHERTLTTNETIGI